MTGNRDSASVTILKIDASPRQAGSITRDLTSALVAGLVARHPGARVVTRDLAVEPPGFADGDWLAVREGGVPATAASAARLAESDRLVGELEAADLLVIGAPMYNFGLPANLKAWIDLVARPRRTFRYDAQGPRGLLTGKRAFLMLATGGTAIGGPADFASGYLRHVLAFLGIEDVELIAAEGAGRRGSTALQGARERIAALTAGWAEATRTVAAGGAA